MTQGATPSVLDIVLETLNADKTGPRYVLGYDPDLQAWQVYKVVPVERHAYKDSILYRLVPTGTSHNAAAPALRDALTIKLGNAH